ncbi:unnamed protein product [Peniophora sp. CBMAI 1063]|nr:unnamed protein product [Peniophora sp. CBMAI 1063]
MPASPTAGGQVNLPRQSNPGGLPGTIALPTHTNANNADPTLCYTPEMPSSTPASSINSELEQHSYFILNPVLYPVLHSHH